jgi:serine/threonine protein phosphatase PrpC
MGQSENMKNFYRIAGTYVTGSSHIKKGSPCQDRVYSQELDGVTVISLADGAGSCLKSEIGAEISTKYIADFICKNFNTIFKQKEKISSKKIIENITNALSVKTKEMNLSLKDFSSTLLFVAVRDDKYIAGHIGDGMIGYFDNNNVKVLSNPENGEYANQTFFTTSSNAVNHFRIYKNKLNNIRGFILMSDGSYECLFDKKNNILTQANKTIFSWLENKQNSVNKVEQSLKENIKSEFLKKTSDDCSINLLSLIKDEVKMKEVKTKDKLIIDSNQLAKNIAINKEHIQKLEHDVSSIKKQSQSMQSTYGKKINDIKGNIDSFKHRFKDVEKRLSAKSESVDVEPDVTDNSLGNKVNTLTILVVINFIILLYILFIILT